MTIMLWWIFWFRWIYLALLLRASPAQRTGLIVAGGPAIWLLLGLRGGDLRGVVDYWGVFAYFQNIRE